MSRKNRSAKRAPDSPATARTGDSFANFQSRLGYGTDNQSSGGSYQVDYISRNRQLLDSMYRSSWVCGQAVDVVAEDMTRAGVTINSALSPDENEAIQGSMESLGLWNQLSDTIKWGRLYGGAIGVLLLDGQDMATPLRLETIGRGQFKGILPLDRWMVQPSLQNLVKEFGPALGLPKFYDVVADSMALPRMRIHYSRVIRIDGQDLPYFQRIAENLWGQSVLERLYDRLLAFDSTTQGAAQLVYKAHLRTLKVDGLREILAMGGPALRALVENVEMIRRMQTNEGLTVVDGKDEFETHQYAFSGLDSLLLQFGQQLSGALQIPLVRLFGQSPAGLNSSGESDLRTYYDNIKQQQERRMRSPIGLVLDVTCRSELGKPLPPGTTHEFNPLWQLSDVEKADVAQKIGETVANALDAGLIDRATGMKELSTSSHITGVFSAITNEHIAEAENDPAPVAEIGAPGIDDIMSTLRPTRDSWAKRFLSRF